MLDEADQTGLLPVGENTTGTGPYGYVNADAFNSKADEVFNSGETGAPLEVYDEDGALIAMLVDGYGFVDLDTWANPDVRAEIVAQANATILERRDANDALTAGQ